MVDIPSNTPLGNCDFVSLQATINWKKMLLSYGKTWGLLLIFCPRNLSGLNLCRFCVYPHSLSWTLCSAAFLYLEFPWSHPPPVAQCWVLQKLSLYMLSTVCPCVNYHCQQNKLKSQWGLNNYLILFNERHKAIKITSNDILLCRCKFLSCPVPQPVNPKKFRGFY